MRNEMVSARRVLGRPRLRVRDLTFHLGSHNKRP